MDLDTGKVYKSMAECVRESGSYYSAIVKCCKGEIDQHHGHRFAFTD